MESTTKSPKAGYWMLVAIVAMLALPMAVGHFVLNAPTGTTLHADANR